MGVLKSKKPRGCAEKWDFWGSKSFFEKGLDKTDFLWYNIWALNERAKNNNELREKSESVVQVQTRKCKTEPWKLDSDKYPVN